MQDPWNCRSDIHYTKPNYQSSEASTLHERVGSSSTIQSSSTNQYEELATLNTGNTAASGMVDRPISTLHYQVQPSSQASTMTGSSGFQHHQMIVTDTAPAGNKHSTTGILSPNTQLYSYISSPRSSICSNESSTMSIMSVNSNLGNLSLGQPPPPYDYHKHSSSNPSLASPRSSITGHAITSLFNHTKNVIPSQALSSEEKAALILHVQSPVVSPSQTNMLNTSNIGVTPQMKRNFPDLKRFNEQAPPPPYDSRPRLSNLGNKDHSACGQPNVVPDRHTVNSAATSIQLNSRPLKINPCLRYDTVHHQEGASSAESKVDELTQQLEDELEISSSTDSSVSQRKTVVSPGLQYVQLPPPPYHGPHRTETYISEPTTSDNHASNPYNAQLQPSFAPTLAQNNIPTQHVQSMNSPHFKQPILTPINMRTLPYEVTKTPQKGQSDAENKMAVITQEIESQIESDEREYFGK